MAEANWLGGLLGGIAIGLAALLLLWGSGRIAGISGIVGGLLPGGASGDRTWRLAFVLGLIVGAGVYGFSRGGLVLQMQAEGWLLIVAGLLVGIGTRLGAGCTSGHGVCGLARRSPRSLIATLTFMAVAVLTVFVTRHVLL